MMMDKSYVTLEQAMCPVCGKVEDTGDLLLDRRLLPTFDHHTVTGYKLCAEHQKLHDDGYVALVATDPKKSTVTYDKNNQPCLTPENAWRTGEIAHVRRSAWASVFNLPAPATPFIFCDSEVIAKLQAKRDEIEVER
jgi:hypothetical protein